MKRIVIIGDYTIDIIIRDVSSEAALCRSASIDILAGGVGRNVALNLKNLGADVVFVTSYNNRTAGAILDNDSQINNLTVHNIAGTRVNIFCAELDRAGQVAKAFYEIAELEKLDPQTLIFELERIQPDCVVLDANLLPEQLDSLRDWCIINRIEYGLEAVSAPKASRIRGVLRGCLLVKFNIFELQSFCCKTLSNREEIEAAAQQIVTLGALNVIVSLGASGSVFASKQTNYYPAGNIVIVNENGAGDAMFAATLLALLNGANLIQAARGAITAAEKTCMVSQSVCPDLKWEELWPTD